MEFKVGDKLRFISVSVEYYTQGDVYEIIDHDEGNDLYTLKFDDGVDFWHTKDVRECFQHIDEPQTQVTKVKLTQEQARALEELKCGVFNNSELIFRHATQEYVSEKGSLSVLSVEKFAAALLIGYDVEQTAEEKVLAAWVKHDWDVPRREKEHHDAYYSGFRKGMKFVLDAYGITVKGINDND